MTYLFWIILLVTWVVLFAMIFGYKAFYKKRANQALEGAHSTALIDPLSFFQVIIMVGTLILGIVAITRIQTLSTQLMDQQTDIDLLNQNINWLRSDNSSLEVMLQEYIESNAWVQESSYEFNDFNEATHTVNTTISFTLKEIESTANLYLVATNQADASDFIKVLVTSDTLTFSADLNLDIEKKYQISFVSEVDLHSKGGLLFKLDFPDLFDNLVNFSAGVTGENQVDYSFNLRYATLGIDNWTIESVIIRYYSGPNVVVSSVDVLSQMTFNQTTFVFNLDYSSSVSNPQIIGVDVQILDSFGNTWTSPQIPLGPEGSE